MPMTKNTFHSKHMAFFGSFRPYSIFKPMFNVVIKMAFSTKFKKIINISGILMVFVRPFNPFLVSSYSTMRTFLSNSFFRLNPKMDGSVARVFFSSFLRYYQLCLSGMSFSIKRVKYTLFRTNPASSGTRPNTFKAIWTSFVFLCSHNPKYIITALFCLGIFFSFQPIEASAVWYSSSWTYRKPITIDNTKVAGSADHTNFPVLVDLTDTGLQANAQADGDDVLFTSADGTTKLDHEIELYTTATGRLTAWVEIPTLDYDNDTTIYMYYGNSGASNQQNVTGVWDSNYKGVWHLKDGTTLNSEDSTSNNLDGTQTSSPTATTGQIDGGMNNSGGGYLNIGVGMPNLSTPTVSAWIKMNTAAYTKSFVSKGYDGTNGTGWEFRTIDSGEGGFGDARVMFGTYVQGQPAPDGVYSTAAMPASSWNYWTGVYDGTTWRLYKNGVQDNSSVDTAPVTSTARGGIGALDVNGAFGRVPDAVMDEVRVSNTARSADWILTEYNNQSATSTFYTIGTQETDTAVAVPDRNRRLLSI